MELEGALRQLYEQSIAHLFEFLLAIVLLIAGLFIGWLLQYIAELLLRNLGLDGFAERSGLARALKQATRTEFTLTKLIGRIVFWTVFLVFLGMALKTVGLDEVADFIVAIAKFIPRVLGAALLTIGGLFAAKLARKTIVEDMDHRDAPEAWEQLGRGIQIAIVTAAILLALLLLGLDLTPLVWLIGAALVIGGALVVVSWGAMLRDQERDRLMARRLRRQIKDGDLVRVGEVEGFVTSVSESHLTLQTTEGLVHLPHTLLANQPLAVITMLPESAPESFDLS